jgi:hypothetical protein
MKGLEVGLAAALILAAAASSAFAANEIPAEARKAGMTAAPGLITTAKLPCTLADARQMGTAPGGMNVYEIACTGAMGYVVLAKANDPAPTVYDCIRADEPQGGKPSNIACKLPGNLNPGAALGGDFTSAGRTCSVQKSHWLGSTADGTSFDEVLCEDGGDYVVPPATWAT